MSKQSPTIMVVEDEVLLLQAITKKLKLSGLDVISCSSGKQALDYLESLDELPDVCWTDFYLKDMNGLELLRAFKSNRKWARIPFIVVSNSASPTKVQTMLALGAKKYILKAEYRLDEIIAMVLELMADTTKIDGPSSDSDQQIAPPSAPAIPAPAPPAAAPTPLMPVPPVPAPETPPPAQPKPEDNEPPATTPPVNG